MSIAAIVYQKTLPAILILIRQQELFEFGWIQSFIDRLRLNNYLETVPKPKIHLAGSQRFDKYFCTWKDKFHQYYYGKEFQYQRTLILYTCTCRYPFNSWSKRWWIPISSWWRTIQMPRTFEWFVWIVIRRYLLLLFQSESCLSKYFSCFSIILMFYIGYPIIFIICFFYIRYSFVFKHCFSNRKQNFVLSFIF